MKEAHICFGLLVYSAEYSAEVCVSCSWGSIYILSSLAAWWRLVYIPSNLDSGGCRIAFFPNGHIFHARTQIWCVWAQCECRIHLQWRIKSWSCFHLQCVLWFFVGQMYGQDHFISSGWEYDIGFYNLSFFVPFVALAHFSGITFAELKYYVDGGIVRSCFCQDHQAHYCGPVPIVLHLDIGELDKDSLGIGCCALFWLEWTAMSMPWTKLAICDIFVALSGRLWNLLCVCVLVSTWLCSWSYCCYSQLCR